MGYFQLSKRYPKGHKGSRIQGFKCKGRGRNRALELKKYMHSYVDQSLILSFIIDRIKGRIHEPEKRFKIIRK